MLETRIKEQAKQQKQIEVLDKTQLYQLNVGAEDTSTSEDEYDSEHDEQRHRPPKRNNISSSM